MENNLRQCDCGQEGIFEEEITYTEEDGYICWDCYAFKYAN